MSEPNIKLFASKRVILRSEIEPLILIVKDGRIHDIVDWEKENELDNQMQKYPNAECFNYRNFVLMPGLVDSHVHVNEPGRTDWEGFRTATRAAAAAGVTTIIDMPLNSIPPTTTLENLKTKARAAQGKSFVDVGFWGGVIPGNQKELKPLVKAGVVGFKCFLCPSGVDEFPHVSLRDVEKALTELKSLGFGLNSAVLAFHAELESKNIVNRSNAKGDPCNYNTFLKTRPQSMEVEAVKLVINLCRKYKYPCHIVHLSAAEALGLIKAAKEEKLPLTAETCYHYLCLKAEDIPRGATQFKCCPPIRTEENQKKLWSALKNKTLDMIVSDHSPCTENLKESGDFLEAWGGISSLQFGLPLMNTHGLDYSDITRLMTTNPAELCFIKYKSGLFLSSDADFVIWDPNEHVELTPYLGKRLRGKVIATVVRGNFVYKDGKVCDEPIGKLLLDDEFLATL